VIIPTSLYSLTVLAAHHRLETLPELPLLAAGVVHHLAGVVEYHRRSFPGRVCRPVRQSLVVGVAAPGELNPRLAYICCQLLHLRTAGGHYLRDVGIVEHEWDLDRMCRPQLSAQRRLP